MNEAQTIKAQVQPITECKNLINGEAFGSDSVLPVYNPATSEQIAALHEADAQIVDRAVSAAQKSFQSGVWRDLTVEERQSVLRKIAQLVDEHAETLAGLECLNTGIPYAHLLAGQIRRVALNFRFFADYIGQSEGDLYTQNPDYLTYVRRDPVGVCALVGPWNAPLALTTMKLAAALAFGNSCVVKASEQTPMTLLALMPLLQQAGVPDGVVNVVNGSGVVTGAALSAHAGIARISFTGGTQTGKQIMTLAAQNLTPVTMELGGKSAAIVMPDADLDNFMESVRWGIYFNAGQVCSAMSRVIAHEDIHDEIIDRCVALAEGLSVGPGIDRTDFGANMGAMVSDPQRDRAEGLVEAAAAEGASIATGGRRLNLPGSLFAPTVISDVTPDMQIAGTEVFGPVLSILKTNSEAQAIDIANSTEYGLVGGIFTADIDAAHRAARRIRAGQIFINEWFAGGVETPFGGYGKSGYGREKGREALWNYVQTKNIAYRTR